MRGGREKKGHMWEGLCSMLKEWDGLTLINTATAALCGSHMLIQFFYFIYAEIFTNFNFHMSHTCGTVVHTEAARRKDAPCQWVCVCVCGGVCIVCVSA